jgi:hypothetical protein
MTSSTTFVFYICNLYQHITILKYYIISSVFTLKYCNFSCSLNKKEERPALKHPVQRAPSRLYRSATATRDIDPEAKYCCPNTCIGPEFVVRATEPSKVIHITGVKVQY